MFIKRSLKQSAEDFGEKSAKQPAAQIPSIRNLYHWFDVKVGHNIRFDGEKAHLLCPSMLNVPSSEVHALAFLTGPRRVSPLQLIKVLLSQFFGQKCSRYVLVSFFCPDKFL